MTAASPYSTGQYASYYADANLMGDAVAQCSKDASSKGDCGCLACRRRELRSRSFGSIEYLHWFSRPRYLPVLASTGTLPAGTVLLGDDTIGGDRHTGGRLTLGLWSDCSQTRAFGVRAYSFEGESERNLLSSASFPFLARPFFNTDPIENAQDSLPISSPGLTTGFIGQVSEHDFFGGEAYVRSNVDTGCHYRVDLVAGYQFNRIDDDLVVTSFNNDGLNTFGFLDIFNASNQYHAGNVGVLGEWNRGCWTLSMLGKIAFGNMQQEIEIAGLNSVDGAAATLGGFLAQPNSNIGIFDRDVWAWAPEAGIKVSYAASANLSFSVGYTFMYWTEVLLAGDQVNTVINGSQFNGGGLVGPPDPTFNFNTTDYYVQSVDLGMNWSF